MIGQSGNYLEVDEHWLSEWVGYGISELERYLGNDARFKEWEAITNGREWLQ